MQQTFRLRDLVPMLAIDVAIPYGLYVILSPHFPSNSFIPLLIAALPPAVSGVVGVIRKGHIDYVGALVVLGILITVVAAAGGRFLTLADSDKVELICSPFRQIKRV